MKKTLITYLLIPGLLLGVFLFFYLGAVKEMKQKEERQRIEKSEKAAADAKRKGEIEKKANEDAKKRQEQRDAEDAAKLAKKEADYQAVMTQLRNDTTNINAEADKLAKEVGALEINISQARTNKERLNRETFELAKAVELAKINRRNAEMEIQRMVEMAGKKMSDTSVAIAPPPPPPAPPSNWAIATFQPSRPFNGAAFFAPSFRRMAYGFSFGGLGTGRAKREFSLGRAIRAAQSH